MTYSGETRKHLFYFVSDDNDDDDEQGYSLDADFEDAHHGSDVAEGMLASSTRPGPASSVRAGGYVSELVRFL